jgi:hypothetical protein
MKRIFLLVVIFLNYSSLIFSQISEFKLLPISGPPSFLYGYSVSISGNYAIVGSVRDTSGFSPGAAFIFRKDGSNWIEEQMLIASDGSDGDEFGISVSIFGDYAIVGADANDDQGTASGSAYIFRRNGINWIEIQKLLPNDGEAFDLFGNEVSISGNYAIVGSIWDDDNGENSGSAYIFARNGPSWIQAQKLTANEGAAADDFGWSVSISDSYAIVGARGDDDNGNYSGAAYVYRILGTTWVELQKLKASDGTAGDLFGGSVSLHGDLVIVGAGGNDYNGSSYIYRMIGANWIEEQKLYASDGAEGDFFGGSVAISGDYAIVGAPHDDDSDKLFKVSSEDGEVLTYELSSNFPNPYNPTTTIKYQIPSAGLVTLKVYDVLGNEVGTLVSENKEPGRYDITFDASALSSGVYIYQLIVNDYLSTKKMVLMK